MILVSVFVMVARVADTSVVVWGWLPGFGELGGCLGLDFGSCCFGVVVLISLVG